MTVPWLARIKNLTPTGETDGPVNVSGIYDVVGDTAHKEGHQVTCVKGELFPPCAGCNHKVKFRLHFAAHHLSEGKHRFH